MNGRVVSVVVILGLFVLAAIEATAQPGTAPNFLEFLIR